MKLGCYNPGRYDKSLQMLGSFGGVMMGRWGSADQEKVRVLRPVTDRFGPLGPVLRFTREQLVRKLALRPRLVKEGRQGQERRGGSHTMGRGGPSST